MRTHPFLFIGFLIGLAGIASAQKSSCDYTQWRGRNRDGAAACFSRPRIWPDQLRKRWSIEVGEGYATPLVVGNRVYCFGRSAGNEVMIAVSATNGKTIWRTEYPAPYTASRPALAHGAGPKATPLFHNGKLFTLGISGIVSAFDLTNGKLLWQKPGPATAPAYGDAVSPIAYGNLVIFHVGDEGYLTAFDVDTGERRWELKSEGPGFASPITAEFNGVKQLVAVTQEHIIGVALDSGLLLWSHPWISSGIASAMTPIQYADTVIVGGQGVGVAALRPILRQNTWAVDVAWQTKDVSIFISNPVLVAGTIYGLSEKAKGQFFALDAKTGSVLWLGPPRQAANTAVARAGDTIFLLDDDAELIIAQASRTRFEPLKHYNVADSATWAQPAISGNRIFIKDVKALTLWSIDQ